jgi:hypothetical protein
MKTLHIAGLAMALFISGCKTTCVPPTLPLAIHVTAELYDVDLSSVPSALIPTTLTVEFLAQLVKQEKATRTKVVSVLTRPKKECTLKVVTEYIYPTEYESKGIGSRGNNNNNSGGKLSGSVGAITTPSSFETREVGTIFSIFAEFLPDGRIELTMAPEFVAPPIWKAYGHAKDLRDGQTVETVMEQPFFHTFTFESAVLLRPGQPVIVAHCPSLESDDKVTLMVIKATTF